MRAVRVQPALAAKPVLGAPSGCLLNGQRAWFVDPPPLARRFRPYPACPARRRVPACPPQARAPRPRGPAKPPPAHLSRQKAATLLLLPVVSLQRSVGRPGTAPAFATRRQV
jgi:hypothetical protein